MLISGLPMITATIFPNMNRIPMQVNAPSPTLPSLHSAIEFATANPKATLAQTSEYAAMVGQASKDAARLVADYSAGAKPVGSAIGAAIDGVRSLGEIAGSRGSVVAPLTRLHELAKLADTYFPGGQRPVPPTVAIGNDVTALNSALASLTALAG